MDIRSLCSRNGGAIIIGGLGAALFSVFMYDLATHQYYLRGPIWLFPIGVGIVLVLVVGLLYGGYWLTASELPPEKMWQVTIWCITGLIGSVSMTFWPLFYQQAIGVVVEDPLFVLVVSAGIGANSGLLIGIYAMSERQRVEDLEQARDALTFVNRLLRHNVLNATNIIGAYVEFLDEEFVSESAQDSLRTIRNKNHQITHLIQNVGVIGRQLNDTEQQIIDFSTVCANEIKTARGIFDHADFTAYLETGTQVKADPQLAAVVGNILRNAVEHSDQAQPRVVVSLVEDGETAILQIEDNGPGIPESQLDSVFSPGEYGDQGLGLYIAHKFVTDYGGEIRIENNDQRGTIVTLELPLVS